jgi:DNA primase large subunit
MTAQELEEYYWNKSGLIVYEKLNSDNPEKKKIKEIYIDNIFLKFVEKYKIEADDRDKLKNLVKDIRNFLIKYYNIHYQAICSEESGRGYHIWINLEELTTLKRAYDFREDIFEKILLRFGVELDEINPKQDDIDDIHKCPHCEKKNRITVYNRDKFYTCRYCNTPFEMKPNMIETGLGNFVKLPYSINRNTNTECIILDEKFDLATQKAFIINELVKKVRREKKIEKKRDSKKSEVDLEKWTPLDKDDIFFYTKLRYCFKEIINGRQATGTYGHDIRRALANELFKLKAPLSTRVNAFARQKDFEIAKTTYQIEDLEMRARKSNRFFTSNCKTIAKWGFCYSDCPYRYKAQEVSEDQIIKLLMSDVSTIKGITGGWTEARELLAEKITNGIDTKEYVIKTTRSGTTTNVILETIEHDKKLFMIAPTIRICDITVQEALDKIDKEVKLFRFGSNKDLCIRLAERIEASPTLKEFPFLLKENCRGCIYNTHVPCAKHEIYSEKCEDCRDIHKNREKCNWRRAIEDIEDYDIIYITIAKMYALTQTTDPEGLYILNKIYENTDVIFLDEISNVLDVGSASVIFREKADKIYRKIAGERNLPARFRTDYENLTEFMDNRLTKQQKKIWYALHDFVKQINNIHNVWHKLDRTDEFFKINSPLIRILRDLDTHYKEKNERGSGDSDWLSIYKQLIEYSEESGYYPEAVVHILTLAKYKQIYIQYTAPLRYEFRMEVIPAKPVKEFIDFLNVVSEQRQFFTTDATEPPIDVHRMFPNLKELIIDDPMGTAKSQTVFPDKRTVNISQMKSLKFHLKDIVNYIKAHTNTNTMIITQNIMTSIILRKVLDKKKDYKHLTYFRSPLTIGTPSKCRNVITIGNPYPPKNSHRWLADLFLKEELVDENKFDIESLTAHLEYYNAKSNFFQAISRGKDPKGITPSTVYCYGLNKYQVIQLLKFPISVPKIRFKI